LEQQDLNKRLMLALVLSFVILFGFSYLFPQAKPAADTNASMPKTQTATTSTSPTAPTPNTAPAPQSTPTVAPAATPTPTATTLDKTQPALVTIHAKDFIWSIGTFGRIQSAKLLEKKYQTEDGKSLELFDPKQVKPLELRFRDTKINTEAFQETLVTRHVYRNLACA